MTDTTIPGTRTPGWAADADRENDPAYPMRRTLGFAERHAPWTRPAQQRTNIEILRSNEFEHMPAVFGTSTPPCGVSGMLRRVAFRYSESSYLHWLPLVLADRINVAEGILDDVRRGCVPNVFAETGGAAQWKYDRKAVVRRVLGTSALAALSAAALRAYRTSKRAKTDDAGEVIETRSTEAVLVVSVSPMDE